MAMSRRLFFLVTLAALTVLLGAGPAAAGGSWLEGRDNLEPGESVTFTGDVSPGQLGWVEDGPFFAYLRVDTDPTGSYATGWPFILETDLLLGRLEIVDRGPNQFAAVSVTFDVPDGLERGAYDLVYCNDPCTEGFGDLIGGVVYVGVRACGEGCDDAVAPVVRDDIDSVRDVIRDDILRREFSNQLALSILEFEMMTLDPQLLVVRQDDDPISPWLLAAVVIGVTAAGTVGVAAIRRRRDASA